MYNIHIFIALFVPFPLRTTDRSKIISQYAKSNQCTVCVQTMDLFTQMYGAECGNLALKTLPLSGLYIAGGVAAKNQWVMTKNNQFLSEMKRKGRMQPLLEKIPVYLVTNESVGLYGSCVIARRLIQHHSKTENLTVSEKLSTNLTEPMVEKQQIKSKL